MHSKLRFEKLNAKICRLLIATPKLLVCESKFVVCEKSKGFYWSTSMVRGDLGENKNLRQGLLFLIQKYKQFQGYKI